MTRTTCMPNYLRNEVVLVRYSFSDLTNFKVRPGVVINGPHTSDDLLIEAKQKVCNSANSFLRIGNVPG